MNCLNCVSWNLRESNLRTAGYGKCMVLKPEQRAGRSFSAQNECRFGAFAQAPADTVARRERAIA